jgi:hypothetical protein
VRTAICEVFSLVFFGFETMDNTDCPDDDVSALWGAHAPHVLRCASSRNALVGASGALSDSVNATIPDLSKKEFKL